MKLLLVEPDDVQSDVYRLAFSEHFDVLSATSTEDALNMLNSHDIGVVITEWQLGSDTAAAFTGVVADGDAVEQPVIVVVSEDIREASMIEAFNHGVSHYITKPYNTISFFETIISIKNQIEIIAQMRKDNSKNRAAARTALSQASIYGAGMEITAALNRTDDIRAMAKTVLTSLRLNGVHAALQFREEEENTTFDTDLSDCDPTTLKVFEVLHNQGRIYRFGRRLMLNDEHVSLLVKHVAKDDPVLYDAILDMGAKLVPAINTRFNSLRQQRALVQTHSDVETILDRMHQTVLNLSKEKHEIIESVSSKIQLSFHQLEMTESQETFFLELIEKELQKRAENSDLIDLDSMMNGISQRLRERIAALSLAVEEAEDDEYQDVEFF